MYDYNNRNKVARIKFAYPGNFSNSPGNHESLAMPLVPIHLKICETLHR